MAWAPNPQEPAANFEGPIIENVLTLITRDFKEALDYYFAADALEDFRERALGQILGNEFPCLAITPRDNPVEESADRSHLVEAARVNIYIGVAGDGPNTVTRKIMKYVKVMDAILRTGRRDFFTGMSNPFGIVLDVRHSYGPIGGPQENIYFRGALVELTVNLNER